MNRHTTAREGKRVRLVLRGGRVLTGRLGRQTDRYVEIEGHGRVWKQDIRSFAIAKART